MKICFALSEFYCFCFHILLALVLNTVDSEDPFLMFPI